MEFSTTQQPEHTLSISDGQVRYYLNAEGCSLQQVADAFLRTYAAADEADPLEPVRFDLDYAPGSDIGSGTINRFEGFPGGCARVVI